jgi:hypothetical protein
VTQDIPAPPPPSGGGNGDDMARKESEFLDTRPDTPELAEARRRHLLDIIEIRRAFMHAVRLIAYVLPFVGLAMVIVWVWHMLAPINLRWLTEPEINHLHDRCAGAGHEDGRRRDQRASSTR